MEVNFINISEVDEKDFCNLFKTLQKNYIEDSTKAMYEHLKNKRSKIIMINRSGEILGFSVFQSSDWEILNDSLEIENLNELHKKKKSQIRKDKIKNIK